MIDFITSNGVKISCKENFWSTYSNYDITHISIRSKNSKIIPLPAKLLELDCQNCEYIELSNLPETLKVLKCSGNKLISLDLPPI
jgi:hypothetical protein